MVTGSDTAERGQQQFPLPRPYVADRRNGAAHQRPVRGQFGSESFGFGSISASSVRTDITLQQH